MQQNAAAAAALRFQNTLAMQGLHGMQGMQGMQSMQSMQSMHNMQGTPVLLVSNLNTEVSCFAFPTQLMAFFLEKNNRQGELQHTRKSFKSHFPLRVDLAGPLFLFSEKQSKSFSFSNKLVAF